jgi:protein SCO1
MKRALLRVGTGFSRCIGRLKPAATLLLLVAASAHAASNDKPKLPGDVKIAQHLNAQLPLDATFRDETGRMVHLGDYYKSGRPVVLNFVYYNCPMLCPMVLDGLTSTLTELKPDLGKEYDVVTVSIDPRDTFQQAAEKKETYLRRYGRFGAADGWHFLTGPEMSIKKLTHGAGFAYSYDISTNQFAHGAVVIVTTPEGRISRYLFGFQHKARDLRLALAEASQGKVGGVAESLMLLCFHYDPATGKYSARAMNFVRAGGVATVLGLGGFIFIMIRKERQSR